ncbi:uncharacterized protein Saysd1 [Halyomorpha halys]|uniref:uncharacterized protein Saysd1 n=1 Tax=Halyomorpha halys TaxID=286706 RepID=UPI0006D4D084|nr:uncharacterized protein LOC106683382 [Halyomorpha halys]
MDEKLESYRRKKSRELLKTKIKNMATSLLLATMNVFSTKHKASNNESKEELEKDSVDMDSFQNSETSNIELEKDLVDVDSFQTSETLNILSLKTFLMFILWLITYIYAIHIEFGAVYFCICALLFIYFNTRTGKRQRDEISAYSVFNRNCERIDGTFSAEEFEKQLRKGML